jgi:hypothetical protein
MTRRRRKPCSESSSHDNKAPWRRVVAAAVAAAVLPFFSLGGPAFVMGSEVQLSQAHAEPTPGEPGGNHSKPGDNKKKKRDDRRNNNGGLFDRGSDSRDSEAQPTQRRQPPESRVDATQIDQTERNNRLTPDGPNRSVGIETGDDGVARQGPAEQRAPPTNPAEAVERVAEAQQNSIPAKRNLTVEQRLAYGEDRPRLPTDATTTRLAERIDAGEVEFNRQPYGDAVGRYEGEPHADHLIPLRRVAEMPGYADLDRATRESIADSNINIIATTP